MEPSFIRQQIEAKLAEASFFLSLYIENCEREQKFMINYLSEEDQKTFTEVLRDLKEMASSTSELATEVDLAAARLKVLFEEYLSLRMKRQKEIQARLSSTHDGITITRNPLKWSSYGHSVGYNEEHALLDIEYQGGKVYRYKNAPKELFEKISLLSSLRDLKKSIDGLEFVKIGNE
jgi:hypothetical protein